MIWCEKKTSTSICRPIQDHRAKWKSSLQAPVTSRDASYIQCLSCFQLKKCLRIPDEAIEPSNIKLQSDLTYEEKPIRVLEEMERVT